MARVTKSPNITSTTGLAPTKDAPHRGSYDGFLGDGSVEHPVGSELPPKALGDPKDPAGLADIFPDQEYVRVSLHLLAQRLADRRSVAQLSHRSAIPS